MNSESSTEIMSAHFDCRFGAAGDMLLAAMIDSGVDYESWLARCLKIALPEGSFRVSFEHVIRCGIKSGKIEINAGDTENKTFSNGHGQTKQSDFNPKLVHSESAEKHGSARGLSDIEAVISASEISCAAKDLSLRIFRRLARAESAVHGVSSEQVHFHELGAIDAIVDIVGFAIAFDMAGISQVSCTPLPLGSGLVKSEHGVFPVPAPAVVNMLAEAGAPCGDFPVPFECLTPTGAAILCEITGRWGGAPAFSRISAAGYGAGSKNPDGWPNAARVTLGSLGSQSAGERFYSEIISVIEANIDDQSPQSIAFVADRLLAAGALDAFVMPAVMKKGRSGHLLTVLCRPESESQMRELVFHHSSTIGLRSYRCERTFAARRLVSAKMEGGRHVGVKLASDRHGTIVNIQPEFDDLCLYAAEEGISIKEAQRRVLFACRHLEIGSCAGCDCKAESGHNCVL